MHSYPDVISTDIPGDDTPISSWDELVRLYKEYKFGPDGRWIFRGLKNSSYRLQTTLERAILALVVAKPDPSMEEIRRALLTTWESDYEPYSVLDFEGGLIRRFRRQCQHYTHSVPSTPLETLALMRHYSAPTRLQDWTYSFYIAVFFALQDAKLTGESNTCAVWALHSNWFGGRFKSRYDDLNKIQDEDRNLQKSPDSFKRVYRAERRFVCPVNPFFLNERLVIQQGLFLSPGSVRSPFVDNLAELQYDDNGPAGRVAAPKADQFLYRMKIGAAPSTRKEILRELFRMNISHATLFPGLEGFSRSLESSLLFPQTMAYGEKYEKDFVL